MLYGYVRKPQEILPFKALTSPVGISYTKKLHILYKSPMAPEGNPVCPPCLACVAEASLLRVSTAPLSSIVLFIIFDVPSLSTSPLLALFYFHESRWWWWWRGSGSKTGWKYRRTMEWNGKKWLDGFCKKHRFGGHGQFRKAESLIPSLNFTICDWHVKIFFRG